MKTNGPQDRTRLQYIVLAGLALIVSMLASACASEAAESASVESTTTDDAATEDTTADPTAVPAALATVEAPTAEPVVGAATAEPVGEEPTTEPTAEPVAEPTAVVPPESALSSFQIEVWADNWMAVWVNGELVGEDSVPITTERSFNAETFSFEATYPLTVAIEAKDFKETDSGIEYIGQQNQQMGDGGIIAQITDTATGEVVLSTDGSWKLLVIHRAPLNTECVRDADPDATCQFESFDAPSTWTETSFDDGAWSLATEWSVADVSPKDGYDQITWDTDASLIWGTDLEVDNTILLRSTIGASTAPTNAEQDENTEGLVGVATTGDHEAIVGCGGTDVAFAPYIDAADMSCDGAFLYIETDNLADHEMMVGITAWNGQVPLAQVFYASNSWAIPLHPVFNETASETTGQGPIAVAINGVMIFNPTQQSGIYSIQTDPNLIGELDGCGGHSGRGDDYHYHVAPTCLEADQLLGDADFAGIVAYAMDGYPIYSQAALSDGAVLDECGGLGSTAESYRYFASAEYPYVNACFRGDFDMDLQPHAPSIRDIESGSPKEILITAHYTDDDGKSHMEYLFDDVIVSVNYVASDDNCFDFEFVDDITTGVIRRTETYCRT